MESSQNSTQNYINYILQGYWSQHGDPRVESRFFMKSLGPPFLILFIWGAFVQYIGPRWMKNRKPYSLKSTLLVYNLLMSGSNGYFLFQFLYLFNYGLDAFNVQFPSLTQTNDHIETIIWVNNLYLLSKFVDLLGKFASSNFCRSSQIKQTNHILTISKLFQ